MRPFCQITLITCYDYYWQHQSRQRSHAWSVIGCDLLTRCSSLLNALRSPPAPVPTSALFASDDDAGMFKPLSPASISSTLWTRAPAGSAGVGPGGTWPWAGPAPATAGRCRPSACTLPESRETFALGAEPPSAGVDELLGMRAGLCGGLNCDASSSSRRTTFPPAGSTARTQTTKPLTLLLLRHRLWYSRICAGKGR